MTRAQLEKHAEKLATQLQENALQMAARCWCDEETKDRVMDDKLADAFAKRLEALLAVKDIASMVLTGLNIGNVQSESLLHKELRKVMITFREAMAALGEPGYELYSKPMTDAQLNGEGEC